MVTEDAFDDASEEIHCDTEIVHWNEMIELATNGMMSNSSGVASITMMNTDINLLERVGINTSRRAEGDILLRLEDDEGELQACCKLTWNEA